MLFSLDSPLLSLRVPTRQLVLLALITIGISIQLSVPEGTTVTGIDVQGRTETGQTLSLPHATTITGTSTPQSVTAATAPRSVTAVSGIGVTTPRVATPDCSTTTAPQSQTGIGPKRRGILVKRSA